MRRFVLLLCSVWTLAACSVEPKQIAVNGLVVGDKYSSEQIFEACGMPDSQELTEDGVTVAHYGQSALYFADILLGADIRDCGLMLCDCITVGTTRAELNKLGTEISQGTEGMNYWEPNFLPNSQQDGYLILIEIDSLDVVSSISVQVSI